MNEWSHSYETIKNDTNVYQVVGLKSVFVLHFLKFMKNNSEEQEMPFYFWGEATYGSYNAVCCVAFESFLLSFILPRHFM